MAIISEYSKSIVDRKTIKVTGAINGISFSEGSLTVKVTRSRITSILDDGIDDGGVFDKSRYQLGSASGTLSIKGLNGSLENEFRNGLYCNAELITDNNLSLQCQLIVDSLPITVAFDRDGLGGEFEPQNAGFTVYKEIKGLDLHTLFGA